MLNNSFIAWDNFIDWLLAVSSKVLPIHEYAVEHNLLTADLILALAFDPPNKSQITGKTWWVTSWGFRSYADLTKSSSKIYKFSYIFGSYHT